MTTPVLLFDLNDGIGLQRVDLDEGASYILEEGTLCVDAEHATRENIVNGTGHPRREELDRHRLELASMMSNDAPTWYNPTGKSASTIDHVAIPLGLWDNVTSGGPLRRMARHLQIFGCNTTPRRTQVFGDMGAVALMDGAGELCELVGPLRF